VNGIQLSKPTARNNIINGLTALSKYFGSYESFMKSMSTHGIKRVKADPVQAFTRIFNSSAHKGLGEWYKSALAVLNENERLYLRFMLLSGVRAMEGVNSFNLIVELGSKYTQEYYNESTGFLEHFKYPKLFIRNSKNLYSNNLEETKKRFGVKTDFEWTKTFYQYSNRLAYMHFLRKNGLFAYLVFVYFLNDEQMNGP
jgi:hypothetical protein